MSPSADEILKITLTPLGRFFFGGEVVFGNDNAQDGRRRSYLVESKILPQQTSLLGMLREELLRQNNLLYPWASDEKKEKAVKLIGSTGFALEIDEKGTAASSQPQGFGLIKGLSPLFLQNREGELFQPTPLDDGKGKGGQPLRWSLQEGLLKLEHYDAKEGLQLQFASATSVPQPLTTFFTEQHQVGITVTNRRGWREERQNDEEAFFRQTFLRNRNSNFLSVAEEEGQRPGQHEYSFCFWVRLNPGLANEYEELKNATVTMGGERSTFRLKVEKEEAGTSFNSLFFQARYRENTSAPPGYARLLLLSDTYLPRKVAADLGVFPIAQTASFRFFTTTLGKTENYYELAREKGEGQKAGKWKRTGRRQSRRFMLLQRGGVLLIPEQNLEQLQKEIQGQTAFRQVGYNYTQKI